MNTIAGLLILSCLFQLGASRLRVSIRMMAVQGILLGLLPFSHGTGGTHLSAWVLSLGGIVLKGIALPGLLMHVLKRSAINREIEPFVSYNVSILTGIVLLGLSCWMSQNLLSAGGSFHPVLLAASFFMVLTGLFLVISRRKAITQALGYLVMENGIYAAGIGLGSGQRFHAMVELGMLLDVFVGVFLMGIMLFHINREFDHIDADQFSELHDHPALASAAREERS